MRLRLPDPTSTPTVKGASVIVSFDMKSIAPFFGGGEEDPLTDMGAVAKSLILDDEDPLELQTFNELSRHIQANPDSYLFQAGSPNNLLSFTHDHNYGNKGGMNITMSFIDPTYDFEMKFTKGGNFQTFVADQIKDIDTARSKYPNIFTQIYTDIRDTNQDALLEKKMLDDNGVEYNALIEALKNQVNEKALAAINDQTRGTDARQLFVAYGIGEDLSTWAGPFLCQPHEIENTFDGRGSRVITIKAVPARSLLTEAAKGEQLDDGFGKYGEGVTPISLETFAGMANFTRRTTSQKTKAWSEWQSLLGTAPAYPLSEKVNTFSVVGGFHALVMNMIHNFTQNFSGSVPPGNIITLFPNLDEVYMGHAEELHLENEGYMLQLFGDKEANPFYQQHVDTEYSYEGIFTSLPDMIDQRGGGGSVNYMHVLGMKVLDGLLQKMGCSMLYMDTRSRTLAAWQNYYGRKGVDVLSQLHDNKYAELFRQGAYRGDFHGLGQIDAETPPPPVSMLSQERFDPGTNWSWEWSQWELPLAKGKGGPKSSLPPYPALNVGNFLKFGMQKILHKQHAPTIVGRSDDDVQRWMASIFARDKLWVGYRRGQPLESYEQSLYNFLNDIKRVGDMPGTPEVRWITDVLILRVMHKHGIIEDPLSPALVVGMRDLIDDYTLARVQLRRVLYGYTETNAQLYRTLNPVDREKFNEAYLTDLDNVLRPPKTHPGVFDKLFSPDIDIGSNMDRVTQFGGDEQTSRRRKETLKRLGMPVFRLGVKKSNILSLNLNMNPHYFASLLQSFDLNTTKVGASRSGPSQSGGPINPARNTINSGKSAAFKIAAESLLSRELSMNEVMDKLYPKLKSIPRYDLTPRNKRDMWHEVFDDVTTGLNSGGPVNLIDVAQGAGTPATVVQDLVNRLLNLYIQGGIKTLPLFRMSGYKAINRPIFMLVKEQRIMNYLYGFFGRNKGNLRRIKPKLAELYTGLWTIYGFRHTITAGDAFSEFTVIKGVLTPPEGASVFETGMDSIEEVMEIDNMLAENIPITPTAHTYGSKEQVYSYEGQQHQWNQKGLNIFDLYPDLEVQLSNLNLNNLNIVLESEFLSNQLTDDALQKSLQETKDNPMTFHWWNLKHHGAMEAWLASQTGSGEGSYAPPNMEDNNDG